MEVLTTAALMALVNKATGFVKRLSAGDGIGVIEQIVAWVIGIAVVLLASEAEGLGEIDVGGGLLLSNLNFAALVLVGLAFGSAASVIYDFTVKQEPRLSVRRPKT